MKMKIAQQLKTFQTFSYLSHVLLFQDRDFFFETVMEKKRDHRSLKSVLR